jgi:hypothetical protein
VRAPSLHLACAWQAPHVVWHIRALTLGLDADSIYYVTRFKGTGLWSTKEDEN